MSVRPPLFFSFSPRLLDLFSLPIPSLSTWPLFLSLKTQGICLLCLSILRPEVLGLCKRFSERLCSLLPINCAFCSWGDNWTLEALRRVPCFYKFSHLIEHLAECFHVEVIDGVQYSRTWFWVKINTLDTSLGVNSLGPVLQPLDCAYYWTFPLAHIQSANLRPGESLQSL